ncbi:hypothetical protein LXL04_030379 [Taraxacum kok-saghyz]
MIVTPFPPMAMGGEELCIYAPFFVLVADAPTFVSGFWADFLSDMTATWIIIFIMDVKLKEIDFGRLEVEDESTLKTSDKQSFATSRLSASLAESREKGGRVSEPEVRKSMTDRAMRRQRGESAFKFAILLVEYPVYYTVRNIVQYTINPVTGIILPNPYPIPRIDSVINTDPYPNPRIVLPIPNPYPNPRIVFTDPTTMEIVWINRSYYKDIARARLST